MDNRYSPWAARQARFEADARPHRRIAHAAIRITCQLIGGAISGALFVSALQASGAL